MTSAVYYFPLGDSCESTDTTTESDTTTASVAAITGGSDLASKGQTIVQWL